MIILPEDKKIMALLSPEDARQVLLALFSEPDDVDGLSPVAEIAYTVVSEKSDRLLSRQKEFSEKQASKGKKGGAPVGNQNAKKQPETSQNNPEQPETSLTVTNSVTNSNSSTVTITDTFISSSAEPPSAKFTDDSDEMKLCLLLAKKMRQNKPDCKLPGNFQGWCKHIDLMIRIDGRTPKQIQDVILYCQKDAFWQSNILSTKKLREKFDQLSMKMQAPDTGQKRSGNPFLDML